MRIYLQHAPLAEVYDTALIPALALAETHWHRGEVNDGKHKFIIESLKEMIQDRIDRQQEMQAQENPRIRQRQKRFRSG